MGLIELRLNGFYRLFCPSVLRGLCVVLRYCDHVIMVISSTKIYYYEKYRKCPIFTYRINVQVSGMYIKIKTSAQHFRKKDNFIWVITYSLFRITLDLCSKSKGYKYFPVWFDIYIYILMTEKDGILFQHVNYIPNDSSA